MSLDDEIKDIQRKARGMGKPIYTSSENLINNVWDEFHCVSNEVSKMMDDYNIPIAEKVIMEKNLGKLYDALLKISKK